jgi:hypothetical protein
MRLNTKRYSNCVGDVVDYFQDTQRYRVRVGKEGREFIAVKCVNMVVDFGLETPSRLPCGHRRHGAEQMM